jgi:GntR family transcriptional regulator
MRSMRLWFAPGSEVPIYRQMVTQVSLAILAGDLRAGDRLPSTRELARRFGLHANTISAGYRQLEREGWAEMRHGSGVYVRNEAEPATTPEQILDRHIAGFFRAVRQLDLPQAVVRSRVAAWLAAPAMDRLLLVESDPELRQILLAELEDVVPLPLRGIALEGLADSEALRGALPLCRPSRTKLVRSALPVGVELVTLQIRSANAWLAPWLPVPEGVLVGVVSRWPEFLTTARTMLIAGGLPAEALIVRDARRPRWRRGLEQASAILCDAYTAKQEQLPPGPHPIVFRLLADGAGEELKRYAR